MSDPECGCSMWGAPWVFFTLPMARMAGESGKVYSVDMQPGMLRGLEKKSREGGPERTD